MKCNFDAALAAVLTHEGGYVNHPRDPGGATNKGVTQAVYDDWREDKGLPRLSVRDITPEEVTAIYKLQYWDRVKGDQLPAGVDYCVFDFAVNSGVNRAARYLQQAVGATPDGQIGPATLAAVGCKPPSEVVNDVCDARMEFLRRLTTFATFGRGWSRRVSDVRVKAGALT
jgi:lysozyme family protein